MVRDKRTDHIGRARLTVANQIQLFFMAFMVLARHGKTVSAIGDITGIKVPAKRPGPCPHSWTRRLETGWVKVMFVKEFVKFSPVSFGDTRCLGYVAVGYLEQLGQILSLKLAARLRE